MGRAERGCIQHKHGPPRRSTPKHKGRTNEVGVGGPIVDGVDGVGPRRVHRAVVGVVRQPVRGDVERAQQRQATLAKRNARESAQIERHGQSPLCDAEAAAQHGRECRPRQRVASRSRKEEAVGPPAVGPKEMGPEQRDGAVR